VANKFQKLGTVERRATAYNLLDFTKRYLSHGIVMSYPHDLRFRADGPVQVIGMGHNYLLSGEACIQQ
jgi:hypothetical protein